VERLGVDMKHPASRELYAYWNQLRGDAAAPRRAAIEPADIRAILGDTFILEVADRQTYRFRLAGTRLCAAYGRELKGRNLLDFWSAEDREGMATLLAAVSEDAAATVLGIEATSGRDRDLSFEMLILPLWHDGPLYDRVLGVLAPMARPYWLGTQPIVRQRITSLRLLWPEEQPRFMMRAPAPAPVPLPAAIARRGSLVLLQGGKR
jgi:hypothetical protein